MGYSIPGTERIYPEEQVPNPLQHGPQHTPTEPGDENSAPVGSKGGVPVTSGPDVTAPPPAGAAPAIGAGDIGADAAAAALLA